MLGTTERARDRYRTLSGRTVDLAGIPAFVLAELQHLSHFKKLDRAASFLSTSYLIDSRSAAALIVAVDLLVRIGVEDTPGRAGS